MFQIFKTKFTDHEASVSGADSIDVSYPFQSFEEKAVRVLSVVVSDIGTLSVAETKDSVSFTPNYPVNSADIASNAPAVTFTPTDGSPQTVAGTASVVNGVIKYTFDNALADAGELKVTWNTQSVSANIAA